MRLAKYEERLASAEPLKIHGVVQKMTGLVIESSGPLASIGELCRVRQGSEQIYAEVVGFNQGTMLLIPFGDVHSLKPNAEVWPMGGPLHVPVSDKLVGRVLNGLGRPIDGKPLPENVSRYAVHAMPPSPLGRKRISVPLPTGVRAIDGCLTLGEGQRIGLFSGSGIGKSTLLGMIARNAKSDVNVVALVGERGREVREFIEKDLKAEGLSRSVVVVATSDQPAIIRIKAAFVATAIAEFFRNSGRRVLLMMDSVTRFALALREVGLAIGEPPTVKGYPPSTFAYLPRLLERTGQGEQGSITGIYTVLVDGDDHNEPIADAVRGILDGHIVLSRALATRNHYPPIDLLASISRVMPDVVSTEQLQAAARLRERLGTYRHSEDLIRIGAYAKGSSPDLDAAINLVPDIETYLKQQIMEVSSYEETLKRLQELARR